MAPLFHRFLKKRDTKDDQAPAVRVFFCSFGKHPGWTDHMDDLGLETNLLVVVKRLLYTEGIGGNIDSGRWEDLEEPQRLDAFKHVFVWRLGQDVVVGRMWSSSDAKGRKRYPMVVCAHCTGLPMGWIVESVLPQLEKAEARCTATASADDVKSILASARAEVRRLAQDLTPSNTGPAISARKLAGLAQCPEMGPDHQGVLRVLYEIGQTTAPYREGGAGSAKGATIPPAHLRAPACAADPAETALLWMSFMLTQVDRSAPVLLLMPLGEQWLDIIVGEPTADQFYCIRASQKAIPLTTDVPYQIGEDFARRAQQFIDGLAQGEIGPMAPAEQQAEPPKRVSLKKATAEQPGTISARPARKFRPPVRLLVLLGAVLVLVALTMGLILALRPADTENDFEDDSAYQNMGPEAGEFDAQAWQKLCNAYYEWFGGFINEMNKGRRKRWSTIPHLKTIVEAIERKKVEFDPRKIVGAPGRSIQDLRDTPPEEARTPKAAKRIRRAAGVIERVEALLAQWPLRVETAKLSEDQHVGPVLSQNLKSLLAKIGPTSRLAPAIDATLDSQDILNAIVADLREIQSYDLADETIRAKIALFSRKETRKAEDLKTLRARLKDIRRPAGRIVGHAEELQVRQKAIEKAGAAALGKFRDCLDARINEADDLESLLALAGAAKQQAAGIASSAEAVAKLIADDGVIMAKAKELLDNDVRRARDLKQLLQKFELAKSAATELRPIAKEVKVHEGAVGQAGRVIAAKFKECFAAEMDNAADLKSLTACAKNAARSAAEIAAFAQTTQKLLAGGGIAVDKIRGFVDTEAAAARDLHGLNRVLGGTKNGIKDASALAKLVAARAKEIDGSAGGSKLLAAFPGYVEAELGEAKDLARLLKALRAVDKTAADLVAFLKNDWRSDKKFARELFIADEQDPPRPPAKQTFEAWLKTAKGYYRLPEDPRHAWIKAEKGLAAIIDKYRALPDQRPGLLKDFDARLAAITKRIDPVRDPAKTPDIEKNRDLIFGGERKGLSRAIAKLRAESEKVTVPAAKLVAKLLEDLKSGKGVAEAFRKNLWPKVYEGARRDLNADKIRYWRLEKLIPELRAQLIALDKAFQPPRTAELKALAKTKRDEALRRTVEAIPWGKVDGLQEVYPDLRNKDFVRKRNTELEGLRQWGVALAALFADSRTIRDRLNESWHEKNLLDHKPHAKVLSMRELHAGLKQSPIFREPGVATVLEPVTSRIERLLNIERLATKDKKQLIEFAQSDQTDAVGAAWRKLGKVRNWPTGLNELRQEAGIRKKLAQAKFPRAELAAQGPPRWDNCLRSLTDCAMIEEALKLRAEFGVSAENVGPTARYNILLWDFVQRLRGFQQDLEKAGGPKNQEALLKKFMPQISRFEKAIARLPDKIRGKEPVGRFMHSLAELKKGGGEDVTAVKAGPETAGWHRAQDSTRQVMKYRWPKDKPVHSLEFVRIEPQRPAGRPFYLCTTEVTAGLFIEIAKRNKGIGKLLWKPRWRGDTRKGACVWQWQGKQLRKADRWVSIPALTEEDSYYPAGTRPARPQAAHPMQWVSPQAAEGFCTAIGCRLPTSAEWAAAYTAYEKELKDSRCNLRDPAWSREHNHVAELRKRTVNPASIPWPTDGIFRPKGQKQETGSNAKAAVDENDGELWFAPAASAEGATLRHLIGNVAEFVKDGDTFAVVGGSALSSGQLWDGGRRPFSRAYPADAPTAGGGYPDVGFRLAFSAPSLTVKDRTDVLLKEYTCLMSR